MSALGHEVIDPTSHDQTATAGQPCGVSASGVWCVVQGDDPLLLEGIAAAAAAAAGITRRSTGQRQ